MEDGKEDLKEPTQDQIERRRRVRHLVAELRSARMLQTTGALARIIRDSEGVERERRYCCLGVACEVAIRDGLKLTRGTTRLDSTRLDVVRYYNSSQVLPRSVYEWYGFGNDNPSLKVPDEIVGEISDELHEKRVVGHYLAAAELNDEYALSLEQIADCFEYTFLPQDWEVTRAAR